MAPVVDRLCRQADQNACWCALVAPVAAWDCKDGRLRPESCGAGDYFMDTIKERVAHRCSDACARICRCTLVASAKILVVLLSNVFSLLSRLQILLFAGMPFRIGKRWDTVHPCIYNIDTGLWIDSKWCRLEARHCREVLKQFSQCKLRGSWPRRPPCLGHCKSILVDGKSVKCLWTLLAQNQPAALLSPLSTPADARFNVTLPWPEEIWTQYYQGPQSSHDDTAQVVLFGPKSDLAYFRQSASDRDVIRPVPTPFGSLKIHFRSQPLFVKVL